jgi:structural maintenance of chromosome 2
MHISEVIIDGFKSYAQRTVISGFDPQFNAITGLNGTGKSNILDAICFVLGISNLSQVRVGNLQELVYKQGQAGVTKASVTIIFNNSDKETSPIGYESHKQITVTRQVVIGGKNKYMINGSSVQQSQVQTLFHSVQLNVNNPHFLIMQGRITKVLNMKPEETLSMIEEAAGTRMFETKKQAAKKTIEKKQLKVEELTKCMDDDITPTLINLRGDRSNFLNWKSSENELERLQNFMIASDFNDIQEKLNKSKIDKERNLAKLEQLNIQEKQYKADADECTNKIEEIKSQREEEIEGGVIDLREKENEASKDLVITNTLFTHHKGNNF